MATGEGFTLPRESLNLERRKKVAQVRIKSPWMRRRSLA